MLKSRSFAVFLSAVLLGLSGCAFRSKEAYVEKGNKLFSEGKYEDAQLNYKKAIQKDPQFGDAYYRLAVTDLRINAAPEAYQALTQAAHLQPDNIDAKVRLADLCFSVYRLTPNHPRTYYAEASKLAEQILAKNPHSVDGFRIQGSLALADKEPKRAIELFRRGLAASPADPESNILLAEALVEDAQPGEAEKLCFSMIQRDPKIGRAYEFLFALYRSQNRNKDAEDTLVRWVSADRRNATPYIRLARYYSESGLDKEMQALLDRMLNDRQAFPHARLIVGDFYMSVNRPADALAQFEAGARESASEKPGYEKAIATAQMALGHKEDASQTIDAILKTNPSDDQALAAKASLLVQAGKLDEAQTIYLDLIKSNPKDPSRHFNLGQILLAKGDLVGAQQEFIAAKSGSRTYLPPRMALAHLQLQSASYREALQSANEILAIQPSNATAESLRVLAFEGMQRYQEARTAINQVLQTNPSDVQTELALADLDVREKRFREAEEIYARLNKPGQTDLRPLAGLLEVRLQQKQFDSALDLVRRDLQRTPNSPGLHQLYADVAFRAGKTEMAEKEYENLVAKSAANESVYLRLGRIYLAQGDLSKAADDLNKAVQMAPRDPAALLGLAQVLNASGKPAEAIAALRKGHQLQPDNAAVNNNLAFFLASENKDLDDALLLARQASAKVQQNPEYQDTLAWVYIRKGMPQDAIPILNALLRTAPNQAGYHYHLATALANSGKAGEARAELKTALADKPSAEDRAGIQALMNKLGSS